MKRIGYIYNQIWSLDNIKAAIMKSSLGKRNQKRVAEILDNIDYYAIEVQHLIKNKKYTPSEYVVKTIEDGANKKTR